MPIEKVKRKGVRFICFSRQVNLAPFSKRQTSLRGAQRRGNLYQLVVVQTEAARQRQEIATPSGLAMTVVPSEERKNRRHCEERSDAATSISL